MNDVKNNSTIELRAETSKNIIKFGEFIKNNTTCKILYINTDPLSESAWIALCEGLAANKSIEKLLFSKCYIDAGVCEELAKVIKQNKTISALRINENKLKYAGTRIICEALKENETILYLILDNNEIDSDTWIYFEQLLDVNKTIKQLSLRYNPIIYDGYGTKLENHLAQNEEWRRAMTILKKNIERQSAVYDLPKELWLIILSYIKY